MTRDERRAVAAAEAHKIKENRSTAHVVHVIADHQLGIVTRVNGAEIDPRDDVGRPRG